MFRSLLVHFGAMGQRAARGGMLQAARGEIYLGREGGREERTICTAAMASGLDGEVDEGTGSDLTEALTHTTPALQLRSGWLNPTVFSSEQSHPLPV
jgi:hypothetical protein